MDAPGAGGLGGTFAGSPVAIAAAALVGRRFGTKQFRGKTLEGSTG